MLKNLLLLSLILHTTIVCAQKLKIRYADAFLRPCKERKAVFRKEIDPSGGVENIQVKCFRIRNNSLVFEGYYESLHPEIEHGPFKFYKINPKQRSFEGNYEHGKLAGIWKVTDSTGTLINELDYTTDTTSLTNIKRTDKPVSVTKQTKNDTSLVIEVQPYFGDTTTHLKLLNFIKESIIYPPMAFLKGQQGKSIIGFVINRDGSLSDFKIISTTYKDLGWEAVRVLAATKKWRPGTMNEIPVPVKMTVPIKFYYH